MEKSLGDAKSVSDRGCVSDGIGGGRRTAKSLENLKTEKGTRGHDPLDPCRLRMRGKTVHKGSEHLLGKKVSSTM